MNTPVEISEDGAQAVERFAKEVERAQTERRGEKRIDAARRYEAARRALSPREAAILDMTVLRRRSLEELAQQTGQPLEALRLLLVQAGERLADHFSKAGGSRTPP